jgi:hypothetical protein
VAKPKNSVASEQLLLTVSPGLIALLERITDTQFYGKNVNETSVQIIEAEVRRLVVSGELAQLLATRPVTQAGKEESEGS